MSFREEERDFLITNAARDRAEVLLSQLRDLAESAARQSETRDDLSPNELSEGRHAMEQAIAATERMLVNLNEAMAIARQAVQAGGWHALDAMTSADKPGRAQSSSGLAGRDGDTVFDGHDHCDDQ